MTLIVLITTPVTLAIMIPLGKQMEKVSRSLQDKMANFSGYIQQTVGEIRLMKASTAEQIEEKKGATGIDNLLRLSLQQARINAFIQPILQLVMMLVIVMIISYGAIQVSSNSMTIGKLVAFSQG